MLKIERLVGGKGTLRCGEITSLVGGVVGCENMQLVVSRWLVANLPGGEMSGYGLKYCPRQHLVQSMLYGSHTLTPPIE